MMNKKVSCGYYGIRIFRFESLEKVKEFIKLLKANNNRISGDLSEYNDYNKYTDLLITNYEDDIDVVDYSIDYDTIEKEYKNCEFEELLDEYDEPIKEKTYQIKLFTQIMFNDNDEDNDYDYAYDEVIEYEIMQ